MSSSGQAMTSHGLPTPTASLDIAPKPSLDTSAFSLLPPAAIASKTSTRHPSIGSALSTSSEESKGAGGAKSDSSYQPASPAVSPKTTRRRTSAATRHGIGKTAHGERSAEYTLPPPPTRSRKIIQMKPRGQPARNGEPASASAGGTPKSSGLTASSAAGKAAGSGTKRKSPGGPAGASAPAPNTAAIRKIARKTAHSLIERRRRSKMNEEFGVLKDMIPACTGQEMHKLAILQASIEYMRYLEECLTSLKSAHENCPGYPSASNPSPVYRTNIPSGLSTTRASSPTPSSEDCEMADVPPPVSYHQQPHQQHHPQHYHNHDQHAHPSVSPAILPQSSHTSPQQHPHSFSATPTNTFAHPTSSTVPSLTGSALPSPAFEAMSYGSGPPSAGPLASSDPVTASSGASSHFASFELASPALLPMPEDQEATAALLMLNTDRRSWVESGASGGSGTSSAERRGGEVSVRSSMRGISVRDLLIS